MACMLLSISRAQFRNNHSLSGNNILHFIFVEKENLLKVNKTVEKYEKNIYNRSLLEVLPFKHPTSVNTCEKKAVKYSPTSLRLAFNEQHSRMRLLKQSGKNLVTFNT